ncbi:hypothetical protein DY000_02016987 [Brassica cretica]|uniref:Uncharacterized protein n=1 Tax=Brassica cretica TaxID=69181 RepID=A0ABQ7CVS3_BRACR|nr:hypothetical protein DY000_02016987 [Brassica cretica]
MSLHFSLTSTTVTMKFLPPRQFLIRIFCNGVSVNTVLCCCSSSAHDRSHNYKRVRLVSASGGGLALSSCEFRFSHLSSNEDPTEEYDEDYWKERAIEIAMQDERYSSHSFNNTSPPSIDIVYSALVDTHPHPAKRSYASIDTTPGTSIDIKAAAFEKEKGNIPIPSKFTNTYIRSFAPHITSHDTIAEKMNAPINKSEGTSRKSIRSKNPYSADKRLPSIDTPVSKLIDSHSKPKLSLFPKKNMSIDYGFLTPDEFGIFRDPDGHARAMDGRILQVSRENIADILQLANGPDNLFMQQHSIPDNIPAVPDEHPRADTTEIGSHQSCQPVGQTSID